MNLLTLDDDVESITGDDNSEGINCIQTTDLKCIEQFIDWKLNTHTRFHFLEKLSVKEKVFSIVKLVKVVEEARIENIKSYFTLKIELYKKIIRLNAKGEYPFILDKSLKQLLRRLREDDKECYYSLVDGALDNLKNYFKYCEINKYEIKNINKLFLINFVSVLLDAMIDLKNRGLLGTHLTNKVYSDYLAVR